MRRIGVVFGQRTELWWDQAGGGQLRVEAGGVGDPAPRATTRCSLFVKDLLGIGEFFHTLARQLSLGQKMRADIALMLLHGRQHT